MTPWFAHTLFMFSAVAAVVAALLVVTRRNPIYCALYLIVFFAIMALDFLIMDAQFLAFMQVLVYAGAIMVLYLFVIMLINPREGDLPDEGGFSDKGIAFIVSLFLFVLLTLAISRSEKVADMVAIPALAPVPPTTITTADGQQTYPHGGLVLFGRELFSQHLLVFELVSILITIAIVGAVHLSLRTRHLQRPGEIEPSESDAREEPDHV